LIDDRVWLGRRRSIGNRRAKSAVVEMLSRIFPLGSGKDVTP
jgi:hypothetical protein